jgi:[acyl-carrier-protein] S-malonyltransferase
MGKRAFIFPGQASQYTGMGRDLYENFAASRRIFEEADNALGFSISDICFTGPDERLKMTEITQPAILTVSVAAFAALQQEGAADFDYCAGHSLGEYSALVAAGCIAFSDAVLAVHKRGKFMQDAAPLGKGAMAAVIGMDSSKIIEICAQVSKSFGIVSPANFNSPEQTVIAGLKEAVEEASRLLAEAGAKKVVPLPVSAPFHTALMMPAQEKLAVELEKIDFRDFMNPLVTNVDAELIKTGAEAKGSLIRQVSAPVRWVESVEKLIENGVDSIAEIGPGKVLTGLIKRIDKSIGLINIEDSISLDKYLSL